MSRPGFPLIGPAVLIVVGAWAGGAPIRAAGVGPLAAGMVIPSEIRLEVRNATLADVSVLLERQTGYEFRVAAGKELQETRKSISARGSLFQVLREITRIYKCDAAAADANGFFFLGPERPAAEVKVGAYRIRCSAVEVSLRNGTVTLPVSVLAEDDVAAEAVVELREGKLVDDFQRRLSYGDGGHGRAGILLRSRLHEVNFRIPLQIPGDARSRRIREFSGVLKLRSGIRPALLQTSLEEPLPRSVEAQGVKLTVQRRGPLGKDWTVNTQISWPVGEEVVGRGIRRTPEPLLLDDQGQVYRDLSPQIGLVRNSQLLVLEQSLRYTRVAGMTRRLFCEVLVPEGGLNDLPFTVRDIPLPDSAFANRTARKHGFYADAGGTLLFPTAGLPADTPVLLGLSRSEGTRWSGWRWLELTPDPDAMMRVENLLPGRYRVRRRLRSASQEEQLEVVVPKNGVARLVPLHRTEP